MTASGTKETATVATIKFLTKIPKRKKISREYFNLCEVEISLNEIIKFITSETNKSAVKMALQQNLINTFQMD